MQNCWVYEPVVPCYESLLFHNAMSNCRDTSTFFPVAVARRHEYGTKYRYLCVVCPDTIPAGATSFEIIEIYKPELGAPYVTRRLCLPLEEHL